MLQRFAEIPIRFDRVVVTDELIADLDNAQQCVEILPQLEFVMGNDYYHQKLPGAIPRVFCRAALLQRMQQLMSWLAPDFGIYFFDVFRTKATQAYLFTECQNRLRQQHPEYSQAQLEQETRKYVCHPDEPARFTAPPHNTGGAIDLALVDLKTKTMLNYGSAIDLSEPISATDFFEQPFNQRFGFSESEWIEVRKNRRILYNAMIELGFTNFPTEWWHYDLGDGMWAYYSGNQTIYHSMETEVQSILSL